MVFRLFFGYITSFSDFNLKNWMEFRGIDLGNFTSHEIKFLMEALGIDGLLLEPSCSMENNVKEFHESGSVSSSKIYE